MTAKTNGNRSFDDFFQIEEARELLDLEHEAITSKIEIVTQKGDILW